MTDKMKYVQDSSILFKDTAADLAQTMLQAALDAAKRDLQQFDIQTQNKLIAFEERLNNLPGSGPSISDERLEDLFKQLQDNAKFAALFANACINLDGVKYTNASLLEAIYLAPKVAEVNFNYDSSFNKINARIDLTDGRAVLMDRTWQRISGDNDPDEIWQERYTTNAWPNAVSGEPNFVVDVYENWVKRPSGAFQRLKTTNFVFGLMGTPCPFDGMPSGIDINNDGIIGTQPSVQPNPDTGTGDTGTGDTGTGDTGTGDTGTGDTGTTEPDPNDPNTDPNAGYQP